MIGHRGRDQPADQVACDVAGDVGGKRAAGIHRAALLAQIGERERERRSHEQALGDAQSREDRQIGCHGEQGSRDRQQEQTDQDAEPAVDPLAEERHAEAGDRHSHVLALTANPMAAGVTP